MLGHSGAIFLDRDGVINQNRVDHVKSWDEFEFIPGVLESIAELTAIGLPIFIVTNQAAINRGMMSVDTLDSIHERMLAAINEVGGQVKKIFYCPHDSHEECSCRKPMPGMLQQAANEFGIDLTQSVIVGDAWTDIGAGVEVGTQGILVLTGRGRWNFVPCWNRFGLDFGAAYDLADATTVIKRVLNGEAVHATNRLRDAFHMALRNPEDALVL
ncbi:MAG: D-glycero-beta-D-manno-heptose 1,7-bisphosphate 7-phosphatase [Anaerolineaceae bacterium]|nr:D-glycero-beta-D-manno-heptose 1,7-bisphosphate 7-phosphatase [Anaerolineaceae bacterium]